MSAIKLSLSRVMFNCLIRYSTTPKVATDSAAKEAAPSSPSTPVVDTIPKPIKKRPSPLEPLQEAPMQMSTPIGQEKSYDPRISKLVDDISRLTLLEVADLNELLKKRLNIPDTPMMGPMSFAAAGPAAPAEVRFAIY